MKPFSLIAALALLGAAPAPHPTHYSGYLDDPGNVEQIIPPPTLWGDNGAPTLFLSMDLVHQICHDNDALGCVRTRNGVDVLVIPNPCPLRIGHQEVYAAIVCHEIGHLNGWPATHGPN